MSQFCALKRRAHRQIDINARLNSEIRRIKIAHACKLLSFFVSVFRSRKMRSDQYDMATVNKRTTSTIRHLVNATNNRRIVKQKYEKKNRIGKPTHKIQLCAYGDGVARLNFTNKQCLS